MKRTTSALSLLLSIATLLPSYLLAKGYAIGIHVSPDATQPAAGTVEAPTTLSDALERGNRLGDTEILLAPGIYEIETEVALTAPVLLHGVEGAAKTTIRRASLRKNEGNVTVQRILRLDHPEARAEGLTLSGGSSWLNNGDPIALATAGGGVLVGPQGGTLASCIVSNNVASRVNYGGGVAILGANSIVTNCLIVGNSLTGWDTRGAGVFLDGGLLTHSTVQANTNGCQQAPCGGGVYAMRGTIANCRIIRNMIPAGGNADWGNGGAMGGGLYANNWEVKVRNCLIAENECYVYGGGVMAYGGKFYNCTIAWNRSGRRGGGVDAKHGNPQFHNCIFEGNRSLHDSADEDGLALSAKANIQNCLSPTLLPGDYEVNGNLVASASFSDPANGDYTLSPDSVAIDTGSADCYEGLRGDVDLSGRPRLLGAAPEIGAYEYDTTALGAAIRLPKGPLAGKDLAFEAVARPVDMDGTLSYRWLFGDESPRTDWSADSLASHRYDVPGRYEVTLETTDGKRTVTATRRILVAAADLYVVDPVRHPGHLPVAPYVSWETAATTLADALAYAGDGSTIHVAEGLYESEQEIILDQGVAIIATDGPEKTIIKRKTVQFNSNPSAIQERVLRIDHPEAKVVGFAITGGWIYGITPSNVYRDELSGAGVLIGLNGGTLDHCVVTNNRVRWVAQGGGVSVLPNGLVTNCVIAANKIEGWLARGGGLYVMTGGRVTHSRIEGNRCGSGNTALGAGAYLNGGTISHSVIEDNRLLEGTSAPLQGAGIHSAQGNGLVDNCLIIGNKGNGNGGGVFTRGGSFVNCMILGNESKLGGGVYAEAACDILNCIIQGNETTGDTGTGAPEWNGTKAIYSHSLCPVALPTADSGNLTGTADFEAGSHRLAAGSLGFDAGTTTEAPWLDDADATDLQGAPRVQGDAIDIGAFEATAVRLDCSILAEANPVLVGTECTFSAQVVNKTGAPLSYRWTIDGADKGTSSSLSATFSKAGDHPVHLTITSSDGEQAEAGFIADVRPVDIYVVSPTTEGNHLPVLPYDSWGKATTNILDAVSYGIDGMTIHVGPGVHPVPAQIEVTRAVRLHGENGAASTHLRQTNRNYTQGHSSHRVLLVNHPGATIEGVTLENGFIFDQRAKGAGLYIGDLGGTVQDCIISNNTIKANMATFGGGAYLRAGTLRRSLVTGNTNLTQTADYDNAYGGGIVVDGGTVRECVISGNAMDIWGTGDIPCPGGAATLLRGAMVNCLVTNNFSHGVNGGVANLYGRAGQDAAITNCTIVANRAHRASEGAGLTLAGAKLDLVNTIVWGNLADGQASDIGTWEDQNSWHGEEDPVGQTRVLHSFSTPAITELWPAGTNRTANAPGFRDEANGDLTLRMTSPCRNAGLAAEWMKTSTDLAGTPRIDKRHVDIGCYEAPYRPDTLILLIR